MSREIQQHHNPDIRTMPLDQFEKKELTTLFERTLSFVRSLAKW